MSKKPTKAELESRITTVSGLLVRGASRAAILRYVSENTNWNVTSRTIENYMATATATIKEGAANDIEYETGKAKERLEYLYQSNISSKDYKAALVVVKTRSELLGLEAPKRLDVNDGKLEIVVKYADDSDG
jgi:hypothetical protein